jgi:hypothetical protein
MTMTSRPLITDVCGTCITGSLLPRANMVATSISNYRLLTLQIRTIQIREDVCC